MMSNSVVNWHGAKKNVPRQTVIRRQEVLDSIGDWDRHPAGDLACVSILNGPASSGLSFFLSTVREQVGNDGFNFINISASDKSPNAIFNQIFTQLLSDPKHKANFRQFLNKQNGSGQVENIIRSLAVCIPVIGPAFGLAEHKAHQHLNDIQSDIDILSIGAKFLAELSCERKLIMAIDATHAGVAETSDFISNFATDAFRNIYFLIGVLNDHDDSEYRKMCVNIQAYGFDVRPLHFPKPDSNFVIKLYESQGLLVKPMDADGIISNTGGDIYEIVFGLNILKKTKDIADVIFSGLDHKPTQLEKKLIGILAVAEQSLPESDIRDLLINCSDVFVEDISRLSEHFNILAQVGVLKIHDVSHERFLSLANGGRRQIVVSKESKIDYHLISQQLFDFYSLRHSNERGMSSLKFAPLLFRLAGVCDPRRRSEFGRAVLRYSILLQNFGSMRGNLSSEVTELPGDDLGHFLLQTTYFVANKEYDKALEVLGLTKNAKWRSSHQALVLEGICHNRLRNHEMAKSLLNLALDNAKSKEETVIIGGYLIANSLHDGMPDEGKSLFSSLSERCVGARNYGYLTRNAAAAFNQETKFSMEIEAASFFEGEQNHYGRHSSLVNAAATRMAMKQFSIAETLIGDSYRELEKYGTQNCVISTFNRMALSAFQGDYNSATSLMNRFKRMPDHNHEMTALHIHFYESLLMLLNGDRVNARAQLKQLLDGLQSSKLARAKDRLFSSGAALSMACDVDVAMTRAFIEGAQAWPDKRDPITTEQVLGFSESWLKNPRRIDQERAFSLIHPPYFAYWYMDEISLLSRAWFSPN